MIRTCTQLILGLVVLPMTLIQSLAASPSLNNSWSTPLTNAKSNLTEKAAFNSDDQMMDLTLDISSVSIDPGEDICLPVTVTNFDEIVGLEVVFQFDPDVVEFVDVQNFDLKDLSGSSFGRPGEGTNPEGQLKLSWLDFSASGVTISDGTAIFEICIRGVADGTDNITLATGAEAYKPDDSIILPLLNSNTITVGTGVSDGGSSGNGSSDLTYSITSANIINGQQTCLEFSVDNFEDIIGTEVNITYDPTVLEFVSVGGLNLKDLSASSFGEPGTGSNPVGVLKLSWLDFSAVGVTLPDGTVIFEVCFEAIVENGTSIVTLGPNPEAYDPDDNIIVPAINPGTVTVGDGSNNGGSGSNDLTYSITSATIQQDQQTCLEFSVDNFDDIIGTEINITYDPSVLEFVSVGSLNLKDLSESSFGIPGSGSNPEGVVKLSWLDFAATGVSLPDGTVIFEICFEGIANGTSLVTLGPNPEAYDPDDNIIVPGINAGTVTVSGGGTGNNDDLTYTISSATVSQGDQTCLEFSVDNFDDLVGTEINITYDPSALEFVSVGAFNLKDLSESSFGAPGTGSNPVGTLKLSWLDFAATGVTQPDGTVIFEMCFEALRNSGSTIVGVGPNPEAYDVDENILTPVINSGTVTFSGGSGNSDDLAYTISSATVNQGDQTCLEFSVDNFDDLVGTEINITYDPSALEFVSVGAFNLKDLSESSFGAPGTGSNPVGTLKLSWLDFAATGVTQPDGTVIFEMCFEALRSSGSTLVTVGPNPEAYDVDENILTPVINPGTVTFADDGMTTYEDFALIVDDASAMAGDTVCVPISVANFNDIVGMEWTLDYDPGMLEFIEVKNFNLKDLTESAFGFPGMGSNQPGALKLSWIDLSAVGVTVPDETAIFEVCFRAIGSGATTISFDQTATLEITDASETVIDFELDPGTVDISGDVIPTDFTIDIGRVMTQPGVAVDVPVSFFKFDGVLGMEYVISYDPNELQFESVGNLNLKDLSESSFGRPGEGTNPAGKLKISWLDLAATGVTLPDGTTAFTVRFTPLINDGVADVTLDMTQPIEFIDSNEEVIDYSLRTGSVTVRDIQPLAFAGPAQITDINCRGEASGAIDISVTGGSENYSYQWSYQGATTQDLMNIPAGTYSVTVTDDETSEVLTESFTVNQPASGLELTATITDATCFGTNDGAISVTITGGATPLNLVWEGNLPDGTPDQTGLNPGDYDLTVVDNNGCQLDTTFSVGQSDGINIDNINTTPIANGAGGAIDLTISGGTGSYNYSWTGPGGFTSSNASLSDLGLVGEYCVTVTDGNACSASACIILTERLRIENTDITQTCAGASNGAITVNITGGMAPYTFDWNNGESQATISDLAAGDYTVTVEDAIGNSLSGTFEVTSLDPITLDPNVIPVIGDENNTNGSIDLSISGGSPGYTIRWSTGASSEDLTNLAIGEYCVTVTDQNSCSTEQCFNVNFTEELLNFEAETTDIICPGQSTGEVRVMISGGASPYVVSFSDDVDVNATNGLVTRTGLPAGTLNFVVTDATNATQQGMITINQPDSIRASSITIVHDTEEAGCTGSIELSLTGGTPGYQVRWNSPNTGPEIIALCAGSYVPTIIDDNNCQVTLDPIIVTSFGLSANVLNTSCPDAMDGGLNLTVAGGSEPFTYEWRNENDDIVSTEQDLINFPAGEYTVTVSEASGNTVEKSFSIGTSSMLSADITVLSNYNGFDVSCPGGADGRVRVDAENGSGENYIYEWIRGDEMVGTEAVLEDARAGEYTVTVIDEAGCSTTESFTLNAPMALGVDALVTDVSCPGENDGEITVSVNGGTGQNFQYNWSNGQSGSRIRFLRPNSYTVSVTDGNNCTSTATFSIEQPDPIQVVVETDPADDGCNGSATAIVTGGQAPYFYEWNANASEQDSILENLCPGDYVVRVTDSRGCTAQQEVIRATVQDRRFPCMEAREIMTPDGDGLNERFLINCIEEFDQNNLRIFNRYGQMVFETDNYDNTWNGTTNDGETLPDGPYYYILEYTDFDGNTQQMKGSITLLREE
jgi:trimeric autotransporter adhesin